nr:hypothetical protein [Nostoc sp. SerVER01]
RNIFIPSLCSRSVRFALTVFMESLAKVLLCVLFSAPTEVQMPAASYPLGVYGGSRRSDFSLRLCVRQKIFM